MSLPEAAGPLGLFGGTFDPIHRGHLGLAIAARDALGLDGIRWLPSGRPGHRNPPQASAEARAAMVALAIAGQPGFELDRRELQTGRPTYTVPMLESLRADLGVARPLVVLLGADAFAGLRGWYRWRELLGLAHMAVAERPGHSLCPEVWPDELAEVFAAGDGDTDSLRAAPAGRIVRFALAPQPISATAVRAALATGTPVDALLPGAVLDYIRTHQLYPEPHERF